MAARRVLVLVRCFFFWIFFFGWCLIKGQPIVRPCRYRRKKKKQKKKLDQLVVESALDRQTPFITDCGSSLGPVRLVYRPLSKFYRAGQRPASAGYIPNEWPSRNGKSPLKKRKATNKKKHQPSTSTTQSNSLSACNNRENPIQSDQNHPKHVKIGWKPKKPNEILVQLGKTR